jgi:hypothetical protein
MSNKYFNFTLPNFQDRYGIDWDDFKSIVNSETDTLISKILELYWLKSIDRAPVLAVEFSMLVRDLFVSPTDTLAQKKYKLRTFNTTFKNKGMEDFYLDLAEEIVGTRGVIYSGYDFPNWRWNFSRWLDVGGSIGGEEIAINSSTSIFYIFIDVKTTDADELDKIEETYEQDYVLPAFYKIILIDSNFQYLREVGD